MSNRDDLLLMIRVQRDRIENINVQIADLMRERTKLESSIAELRGRDAALDGRSKASNPFGGLDARRRAWNMGWAAERKEMR